MRVKNVIAQGKKDDAEAKKIQWPQYMSRFLRIYDAVKGTFDNAEDFWRLFLKVTTKIDSYGGYTTDFPFTYEEQLRKIFPHPQYNDTDTFLRNFRDIYGPKKIQNVFYETINYQPLDQDFSSLPDPANLKGTNKKEKLMSLAERKAAAEKEEANKNKIPTGTYQVRLKDWAFGKSQKGADMYTLTWKLLKVIELENEEEGEELEIKGKNRKTRYLPSQNWSILQLMNIIEAAGADLSNYDEISDIDDILEQIEDTKMPKASMKYENVEGKQYPNIDIFDVEQVLTAEDSPEDPDDADEDEDEDDLPPAKPAKGKRVKAPGKK